MHDVVPMGPALGRSSGRSIVLRLLSYLPRGNTLDDRAWHRRHRLLERVLLLHGPLLVVVGLTLNHSGVQVAKALVAPAICLALGHFVTHRRWASFLITGGLVFCSIALVLLTAGSIEAHFHFFIIIGFIALYQDWVPFLWNVAFTTISHGMGTIWLGGQIFNHPAAQAHPWLWSFVHGVAVLFACVGVVIFWRITEEEQGEKEALGRQLITADAEIGRRKFTSEMLVNLARRNQSMLYPSSTSSTISRTRSATPTRSRTCSSSITSPPASGATPRASSYSRASRLRGPGPIPCRCATSSGPRSPRPRISTEWCSPSTTASRCPAARSRT